MKDKTEDILMMRGHWEQVAPDGTITLRTDDADKPAALLAYARQRGFTLAPDVIRYLLVHGRRDMATLLATLAALDRHSLATKRPVTLPMLRGWLQREIGL